MPTSQQLELTDYNLRGGGNVVCNPSQYVQSDDSTASENEIDDTAQLSANLRGLTFAGYDIQKESTMEILVKTLKDETGPDSAKAETTNNHTEEPRAEIVQNPIGEPWITGLFDCHQNRTNAIMTAFLPCMTFGQIAEVLDGGKMCLWTCAELVFIMGLSLQ
ncbi:hypothetical protein IFM89_024709 [Coptis chinensis]|uniref:Uncharacterized protein n=1 Tax=Coptis chinensis TaxID=261450 RepID=A0A835IH48_9MAGN|nr:hypothetical protein IFM89_024709 [Coptis chinensis]